MKFHEEDYILKKMKEARKETLEAVKKIIYRNWNKDDMIKELSKLDGDKKKETKT